LPQPPQATFATSRLEDRGGFANRALAGREASNQVRVSSIIESSWPGYAKWVNGVAASKRDQVAFLKAATWPDPIKSKAGYT
jgi:hypothetical protein